MSTQVRLPHDSQLIMDGASFTYPDNVQASCYDNVVPPYVTSEMERLYAHLYCSPSYFLMAKEMTGASTYVARKNNVPVTVLPYKREGNRVTVIGEFMTLCDEDINRFAECIFTTYDSVNVISFPQLRADIGSLAYPWHAITCSEDMVLVLPPTVKDYETALGKNMRRNIKRYSKALTSDHPSYRFEIFLEDEITEQHIHDIIALSCSRMKSKNIVPRFNDEEENWIARYAKQCGIIGMATIDGRICGGAIGFRVGDNYMMHVIAHDLKYNDYGLGILCYYHTICAVIGRGGKRFHLLQGRYGYKYRLLAERQDIIHLDVFRSRLHFLGYGKRVFSKEFNGRIRLVKQWLLHDVERHEGKAYRLLGRAVNALRSAKRSKGSPEG